MQSHKAQLTANHNYCLEIIPIVCGRWLIPKPLTVLMEIPPTDPNTVKICRHGVSAKIYFVEIILVEPQSREKPPQIFFAGLHIVTQDSFGDHKRLLFTPKLPNFQEVGKRETIPAVELEHRCGF